MVNLNRVGSHRQRANTPRLTKSRQIYKQTYTSTSKPIYKHNMIFLAYPIPPTHPFPQPHIHSLTHTHTGDKYTRAPAHTHTHTPTHTHTHTSRLPLPHEACICFSINAHALIDTVSICLSGTGAKSFESFQDCLFPGCLPVRSLQLSAVRGDIG